MKQIRDSSTAGLAVFGEVCYSARGGIRRVSEYFGLLMFQKGGRNA